MNITFCCPRCEESSRVEVGSADRTLQCSHCPAEIAVPAETAESGAVEHCLVCSSGELFVRKDFPQRVGVGIVVVGIVASSLAWSQHNSVLTFAILLATALVDLVLYVVVGDALLCYRCGAQYRNVERMEEHAGFNLETHERYRQQAARLKQHNVAGH
jgi:hypothetical protein